MCCALYLVCVECCEKYIICFGETGVVSWCVRVKSTHEKLVLKCGNRVKRNSQISHRYFSLAKVEMFILLLDQESASRTAIVIVSGLEGGFTETKISLLNK